MNNKIFKFKQLATHHAIWPGDTDAGKLDAEKFAELIVLECANYLSDQGEFNSAENIKALFGVE